MKQCNGKFDLEKGQLTGGRSRELSIPVYKSSITGNIQMVQRIYPNFFFSYLSTTLIFRQYHP